MAHIAVIIPVYKAEDCLAELYRRLTQSLALISEDYEIVLVEDCGGDRSWDMICALCAADSRVKGIEFSRNFGQHYGITAGIDVADADWLVVMDCDLQDQPEEIPRLYAKAQQGYDVVLARRAQRKDGLLKRMTSCLFYQVFNYLSGMNYDFKVGNFRIVSRKVADHFRHMREHVRFYGGMIDWMGFPTASIDVEHSPRFQGQSTYTVRKLFQLATAAIIAYSDKPLWMSVKVGLVMALLAFAVGLFIIVRGIVYGSAVMGWSSLIVSLYFLGGIIMAILGVVGIYLGKVFDEAKGRPLYIIRESKNVRP